MKKFFKSKKNIISFISVFILILIACPLILNYTKVEKVESSSEGIVNDDENSKNIFAKLIIQNIKQIKLEKNALSNYDKSISENTLSNQNEDDKVVIKNAIDNLNSVLLKIKNEKICSNEDILSYENKVNSLISSYNEKIIIIENKEKELNDTIIPEEPDKELEIDDKTSNKDEPQNDQQNEDKTNDDNINNSGSADDNTSDNTQKEYPSVDYTPNLRVPFGDEKGIWIDYYQYYVNEKKVGERFYVDSWNIYDLDGNFLRKSTVNLFKPSLDKKPDLSKPFGGETGDFEGYGITINGEDHGERFYLDTWNIYDFDGNFIANLTEYCDLYPNSMRQWYKSVRY